MAHVDKRGFVVFTKGPDLNEMIDEAIGTISQEEQEDGTILFVRGIPPTEQKLLFMQNKLGFELK